MEDTLSSAAITRNTLFGRYIFLVIFQRERGREGERSCSIDYSYIVSRITFERSYNSIRRAVSDTIRTLDMYLFDTEVIILARLMTRTSQGRAYITEDAETKVIAFYFTYEFALKTIILFKADNRES